MSEKSTQFELSNPIIVGLDVDTINECMRIATLLKGRVGAFKIGPRLCMQYGAHVVQELAKLAPVFVDNKYLDIPNTMESAIRATFAAGATLATVHCWAGSEALKRLSALEAEFTKQRPFKILAVTVLTSFSQETLPPALRLIPIAKQVSELADLAIGCGLSGLVCSPDEVAELRAKTSSSFLVTPGVRLPTDALSDQKRVQTPAEALKRGASALVIARPIVEDKDPSPALDRILASI